ncbi:MAG: YciI family protein [Myxococcota bacterium]|nr:YciI family protein [Myxococcota bacterium]
MRLPLAAVALLLWIPSLALAQDAGIPAKAQGSGEKKFEFEKYQLVILMRGPKRVDPPPPGIEKLQQAHLAHLTRMGEEGKMVLAGPFGDQQDPSYRGMCLYRVASIEEARRLAEADPMVKAGWLKVEVMTWYVEKGYVSFPKAPPLKP